MVDATVSMVLKRLAPMIEETVRKEVCLLINSKDEADKLSSKLNTIHEVLTDAERKGVTDLKVKSWLDKLQEISYEIDDAIDEWEWQNINLQMEELEDSTHDSADPWVKVSSFLQFVCLCFNRVLEHRDINWNIKQLNERLDGLGEEHKRDFDFVPNLSHNSLYVKRIITTSFVDVPKVHGRVGDKETVVSKLLSETSSSQEMNNGVPVVSIVGGGGMGKTTLTQLVLKDDRILTFFQERIWVCVSDPFNEINIAKAILQNLNNSHGDPSDFERLLGCIESVISEKRFLLILDDVWTEDGTMWKPLEICLRNGAPGSRILVTTRKIRVAKLMGSTDRAFLDRTDWDRKILKETGFEIVKKCKGLPLAATAIGSLLRFKPNLEERRRVLKSDVWEMEEVRKDIFPFLVLSYDELHPTAKCCFSYCAIIPKDSGEIKVDQLIRMWCAQGFLLSYGSPNDMELKGTEVFDELAMRSIFQEFEKNDIGSQIDCCKMHDIVHDFAQFLIRDEGSIVEYGGAKLAYNQNARHVNLKIDKDQAYKSPFPLYDDKCRTYLCSSGVIPRNSLRHLKAVRTLILANCGLEAIPSEIETLIHLRYLDICDNRYIKELPETICNLYKLQTLAIEKCSGLSGLPQGIHKLRNLRHILNRGTCAEFEFPQGIEELTNLQTLTEKSNCKNLGLPRNLNQLRGSLCIYVGQMIKKASEDDLVSMAEKADLKRKSFL